jgi:murein DD-endopeptidase MepM/ murein hydrolase activator NlpD
MGYLHKDWQGLFGQLSFAANQLNRGYYLWRAGWVGPFVFNDGSVVVPGQGVNAGTVGVENLFSTLYSYEEWRYIVGEQGFNQTYRSLFGNPFEVAVEPLLLDDLEQPYMQLPFEVGKPWSFTSGPHSAWNTDAGWAALDFAPPGYALGCVLSNEWVVASADGVVARTEEGVVILDLDSDGYEQTGWVLLYLHIEERDRVPSGAILHAGDRIGHPSCEGGVSTGTHLHIARKYNGEWIPADGTLPFIMDEWVSGGQGREYNGTLSRGSIIIEAYFRRGLYNQISR